MSTLTDAITRQVSEQVKKAVEAASLARPLPHFEHMPTGSASPPVDTILQHPPVVARGYKKTLIAVETSNLGRKTTVVPLGLMPTITIAQVMDAQRGHPMLQCLMRHTLDEPLGSKSKSKPHAPREESPSGNALLSAVRTHPYRSKGSPHAEETASYDLGAHTIVECRELRKALHELANKGQTDRFLKRDPWFLRKDREPDPRRPFQRCGPLIFIPVTRRRDELHLFGVPAFSLGPLALLYVANVGRKTLRRKSMLSIRPLRWHNSSTLAAFLTPAAASALALASVASALEGASLSLPCRSFISTSQASFSSLSFFQQRFPRGGQVPGLGQVLNQLEFGGRIGCQKVLAVCSGTSWRFPSGLRNRSSSLRGIGDFLVTESLASSRSVSGLQGGASPYSPSPYQGLG
ncbi:hypothetical protein Cgig2_024244 [Carnegiea gigantea]|uniref:Uncharacterized protein n=1 Tax=Carnegiea gigantea TaxID=171969 RepID=A0A9Q1JZ64_9CARY|nr:hypothetical protein Cgig2_024244 [Carnegiea gigantea]